MGVNLTFYNQSNDANNSKVVIFQKNVATTFDEIAVAWVVIENCGLGNHHPFYYPMTMFVSAADSYGNFTPQLKAENGEMFEMVYNTSGDVLQKSTTVSSSPSEVQVLNNLAAGSISANIYKDGKLLATKQTVAPAQKAVFQFKPTLFIGVVSEVEQGQVMNSAIISNINTELSLLGVSSADIIMTGGGPGKTSAPFQFTLENVVMA